MGTFLSKFWVHLCQFVINQYLLLVRLIKLNPFCQQHMGETGEWNQALVNFSSVCGTDIIIPSKKRETYESEGVKCLKQLSFLSYKNLRGKFYFGQFSTTHNLTILKNKKYLYQIKLKKQWMSHLVSSSLQVSHPCQLHDYKKTPYFYIFLQLHIKAWNKFHFELWFSAS